MGTVEAVSYTHLRAHETKANPSEAEYGKGCRYRMYYAIYRWISGVYDYSHVYIAVLFLLRLQHFTAPYIYRLGEL